MLAHIKVILGGTVALFHRLVMCLDNQMTVEMFAIVQKVFKQYNMYSTLSTIRNKLVSHRTTENHIDLETGKMNLIVNPIVENIKQLLYFWGIEN